MFKTFILCSFLYIIFRSIVWYIKRIQIHKTFTNNGIKGPKPSLISGNFYQIKDNPNETFDEWIEEYGNHFGYFLGDRPILMISDLDAIQTILVKKCKQFRNRPKFILNVKPLVSSLLSLRGDRWQYVRRLITPFFTHHKNACNEITDVINESIDTCIANISTLKESVVKVEDKMQSITLDIICKIALNMYETDVHKDESQLKNAVKEYLGSAKNRVVIGSMFLPFLRPILSFVNNYLTAGRMTDTILVHLNKQIERQTICSNESDSTKPKNVLKSMLKCFLESKLERDELTGNSILLLLAGYDTTAMGLSYALYCLAKNPEIQERLRFEINSNGSQTQYIDMVWKECLRLYPPVATIIQREAAEDVMVNDIFISKGTIVQVPLWHIQHDPNIWPDPYKFDPQRFAPENREDRHPASFLAFGLGPRSCLGIELAANEARLTIAKVIHMFQIDVCDQTPDPIEFCCPTDILYPKHPIYLRFVPIKT